MEASLGYLKKKKPARAFCLSFLDGVGHRLRRSHKHETAFYSPQMMNSSRTPREVTLNY